MTESHAMRGLPSVFDFEGVGDEARHWLDDLFGTKLRLSGRFGAVQHHREDHGSVAFDHIRIDATFAFDSDPMPSLVVVDMLDGFTEYTRDNVTDRVHDGGSVLVSGWDMPFTARGAHQDIRATTVTPEALAAAVEELAPERVGTKVTFQSYVPHSPAAGARWRATVDQLSSSFPDHGSPQARREASRLLGHTLLHTFPNDVVLGAGRLELDRDRRDATPSTVRRAVDIIESHAHEDLSLAELARRCDVTPRALQYAFRRHLGCTPMSYLRRVRLDLVRQALRDGSFLTVTDAATSYGFFNPGRFAAEYRELFAENPGQTLHRSNA
ncbi:MAG TPA: AraC family transcriptional regulator [Nocardioides sp.]|nr:AraC family transcriptional regulator [Nocardioides sp.]